MDDFYRSTCWQIYSGPDFFSRRNGIEFMFQCSALSALIQLGADDAMRTDEIRYWSPNEAVISSFNHSRSDKLGKGPTEKSSECPEVQPGRPFMRILYILCLFVSAPAEIFQNAMSELLLTPKYSLFQKSPLEWVTSQIHRGVKLLIST